MTTTAEVLFEDNTHHFQVVYAPCLVTGQFAPCILAKLTDLDFTDEYGEQKTAEIFGQFSEAGLQALQEALRSAPLPVPIPNPDQVRRGANYQWIVCYDDDTQVEQFPADGEEHHIGHVDLHRVVNFWVVPRDRGSGLPAYCLNRAVGLCRCEWPTGIIEQLGLPIPDVPFHIEYQRRITKTFTAGAPGCLEAPTQIQHELGWRVDTLHGDEVETRLIIAIEDDNGSWQVARKEPLESRHFTGS